MYFKTWEDFTMKILIEKEGCSSENTGRCFLIQAALGKIDVNMAFENGFSNKTVDTSKAWYWSQYLLWKYAKISEPDTFSGLISAGIADI